jgi:hypothetical protein
VKKELENQQNLERIKLEKSANLKSSKLENHHSNSDYFIAVSRSQMNSSKMNSSKMGIVRQNSNKNPASKPSYQ